MTKGETTFDRPPLGGSSQQYSAVRVRPIYLNEHPFPPLFIILAVLAVGIRPREARSAEMRVRAMGVTFVSFPAAGGASPSSGLIFTLALVFYNLVRGDG